jgi:hypothetical protein
MGAEADNSGAKSGFGLTPECEENLIELIARESVEFRPVFDWKVINKRLGPISLNPLGLVNRYPRRKNPGLIALLLRKLLKAIYRGHHETDGID